MIFISAALATRPHPMIDFDYTVLLQFGVFAVLFLAGNRLLFQPYLKLRAAREAGIEGARESATRMQLEADAKDADYQKSLGEARAKAAEASRQIRDEASAHEKQVTATASAEAGKALKAAEQSVRAQTDTARAQLANEADKLASQLVRRLLGRDVV